MSENGPLRTAIALQLNVAQLLKQSTGARRSYDIDVEAPELDESLKMVGPLRGQVRLLRVGPGILANGAFTTTVEVTCTRCLREFWQPVQFRIEEEFRPTIDIVTGVKLDQETDQDAATLIDEHHILDLSEVVRQDLWLSLPPSPICRSDCRGMCPQCGQNRNQTECSCQRDSVDSRWVPLLVDKYPAGE